MTTKIAFIHTVGFLSDTFRQLMRTEMPNVECFHILNESLLMDLLRGGPREPVYRRVVEQILLTSDAQPDMIVVTCSSTSPAVDIARRLVRQPVLKIDDPMAAQAVREGPRIGLLCTATSTVGPSTALLQSHAAEQGLSVSVSPMVNADAYAALMAGDRTRHDQLVRLSAAELAPSVDVIVLAQASLAHLRDLLQEELPCPVLASTPLLMRDLAQRVVSQQQVQS
jgi:Asp/Glu/hydantoin racemase